jgi:hypothetical protein
MEQVVSLHTKLNNFNSYKGGIGPKLCTPNQTLLALQNGARCQPAQQTKQL